MKVTVLGAAGTFARKDSACSAYLVEHDGFTLLLDMGNGSVGALQQYADLLTPDAVFLSHLHFDHCVDLVSYSYARRWHPAELERLPVFGPAGTHERLLEIGGGTSKLDDLYSFTTTVAGRSQIGPFDVTLAPARHPVETYSIRLHAADRTVVYSGDSGPTADLVTNALGADLLLCEATWEHRDDYPPDLHMTAVQAGEHAARAQVDRLWLVHTTAFTDPGTLREQAAASFTGELDVPAAGTTLAL